MKTLISTTPTPALEARLQGPLKARTRHAITAELKERAREARGTASASAAGLVYCRTCDQELSCRLNAWRFAVYRHGSDLVEACPTCSASLSSVSVSSFSDAGRRRRWQMGWAR